MDRRFTRIGVSKHWVDHVRNTKKWADEFDVSSCLPEMLGDNIEMNAWHLSDTAVGYYLNDDYTNALNYAGKLLAAVDNYFFGKWRLSMVGNDAQEWASGCGTWIKVYRLATAFGSALGNWEQLKKLSTFKGQETDTSKFTADLRWYRQLKHYLAYDEYIPFESDFLTALESKSYRTGKPSKRGKLHSDTLMAIISKNQADSGSLFEKGLKQYITSEKNTDEYETKLAFDSTIILNIAKKSNFAFDYDRKYHDYMVIFPPEVG